MGNSDQLYRHRFFLLPTIISFLFAGCAVVTTENHPGTIANTPMLNSDGTGVTYFLPKRRVKLVASATKIPDDIRKKVAQAQTKATDAKKSRDTAETEVKKLGAELEAVKRFGDIKAIEKATTALAEASARLDLEKKAFAAISGELGRLLVEEANLFDFEAEPGSCPPLSYAFKLELQEPEPDPSHRYRATLSHMPWRDDVLTISTNDKGLLNSSKLETTDRTGDIIIEIAKAVAAFGGGVPSAPASKLLFAEPEKPPLPCPKPFTYEDIFDPTRLEDIVKVNLRMAGVIGRGPSFTVEVAGQNLDDQQDSPTLTRPRNNFTLAGEATAAGLLYRQSLPYVISVAQRYGQKKIPIQSALVMLPNEGPVSLVPFTAGAFVRTVSDVQFKDGMLTKWDANRPSEFLAIVRLPVELTKAMLSTIAEVFKLHVNYSNEQTNLINAQKGQLEAAETLRTLKTEIGQSRMQVDSQGNSK